MCGIAGFTGRPQPEVLAAMVNTLVHRGPDEAGLWSGPTVSLGMRRLAIIDVASGQQPVVNETGRIRAVFNGEIYNFVELRQELESLGHVFRSHHSDSEIIVHAYEAWGDDFLLRLNGMFAIALWDDERQRLLLARDRVGIKPLFYSECAGEVLFASELKALFPHPAVSRRPEPVALYHYFSLKNIPAPFTAWQGCYQLPAGCRLIREAGQSQLQRWWHLPGEEDAGVSEAEWVEQLRNLLEDSVRLQMRSDVPMGAYLSGGVDSSSVVALMSRMSPLPVKTFSLVYDASVGHKTMDRECARLMAERCGTEHFEYELHPQEVVDALPAVLAAFDEPYSGVTSTWFLTRLIARHVKVALSGDGADELFGSYLAHRLAQPLAEVRAGGVMADILAAHALSDSDGRELQRLAGLPDEAAARLALTLADDAGKRRFLAADWLASLRESSSEHLFRQQYAAARSQDPLNRALAVDFSALLPDQVLAFSDRLSMAHSVEVRPPFLDHRLVELAARIPGSLKIRHGRVKHILKEAARAWLPERIIDRPKEGFVLPMNLWLQTRLADWVRDTLSPERMAAHGLWQAPVITQDIEAFLAGDGRLGARVWNWLCFQLWWEAQVAA